MAGLYVLQPHQGDDIASFGRVEFDAVIGVHFDDSSDALILAREGIHDVVALLQGARIDATTS